MHVIVTDTLGVLARAAERGFVDLSAALFRLLATNFRIHPALIQQLLQEHENSRTTST